MRLVAIFIFFFFSDKILAQHTIDFFTNRSGLPQSQVLSLAEDTRLGYLWVGTNGGGAARFDGKNFFTYTIEDGLIDNTIQQILIDHHENVWFATPKGVTRFDGKRFHNLSLPEAGFGALVDYQDTVIASTRNFGIIKIYKDSIKRDKAPLKGKALNQTYLTIGSDELFLLRETQIVIQKIGHRPVTLDISQLGAIYDFRKINNKPYVITASGTYAIRNNTIEKVDARVNFKILAASTDFKTVWTLSNNCLLEIKLGIDLQYDTIVKNTRIFKGIMDSENIAWFGTDGKGLIRLNKADFKRIYCDLALAVRAENKKVWIGARGLKILERGKTETAKVKYGQHEPGWITAIKKDSQDNIWILEGFKLRMINSDGTLRQYSVEDGLKFNFVNDIEVDAHDKIWLAFRQNLGVGIIERGHYRNFDFDNQLYSSGVISIKYIPYGDRMLFFTKNGVYQFSNGRLIKLKIPRFENTATYCATPFSNNSVIIGSVGRGICVYNFDTDSVKHFSKKEGLASGLIYFLNVDESGYVWIGSNNGIERVLFDDHLNIKEYLHFDETNGLSEPETNFNASFFNEGDKYFGLVDGLYQYMRRDEDSTKNFALHLTGVSLVNPRYDISRYGTVGYDFFKVPTGLKLPSSESSIQFSFSKISKRYPNATEFKFHLEGLDQEWTSQKTGVVVYRNLPDGEYSLRIKARDVRGRWMEKPLVYSFVVLPPFYKRPIAIFLAVVFAILLTSFIIYFNVKKRVNKYMRLEKIRMEEKVKLRKEIGRDFHDEIGNHLARIVSYIGLIKLKLDNSEQALEKVEYSAKYLIGGTKDFVWSLDHENDSSLNLFIHLKDFGDRLFSENQMEFRVFNEIRESIQLPVGYTRQINLIFKEGMTNAFKYSGASKVTMYFQYKKPELIIVLEDDGIGISETEIQASKGGLTNMKVRAGRINAKITFNADQAGTKISLITKI